MDETWDEYQARLKEELRQKEFEKRTGKEIVWLPTHFVNVREQRLQDIAVAVMRHGEVSITCKATQKASLRKMLTDRWKVKVLITNPTKLKVYADEE